MSEPNELSSGQNRISNAPIPNESIETDAQFIDDWTEWAIMAKLERCLDEAVEKHRRDGTLTLEEEERQDWLRRWSAQHPSCSNGDPL